MPLGTFTLTIGGERQDGTAETKAKLHLRPQGVDTLIDADADLFYFPTQFADGRGVNISLSPTYSIDLYTDTAAGEGESTTIGYEGWVRTDQGRVDFQIAAQEAGATVSLTDLVDTVVVPVSTAQGYVLEAETAATAAETARAAAEAAAESVGAVPTYAAGHTGRFDTSTSVYNLTPSSVHAIRSKVAASINARVKLAAIGHSMLAGSNATPGQTDSPRQLRDFLAASGVPVSGGLVYVSSKETVDTRWSLAAGWTRSTGIDTAYAEASASGQAATFTSGIAGTAVDIAYPGTGRSFTYAIDGGAPVAINPTGADVIEVTSVTGLSNATHTVVLTSTSPAVNPTLERGTASLTAGAAKFGTAGRASGTYSILNGLSGIFTAGSPGTLGTGTIEAWFKLAAPPSGTKVIFGQSTACWVGLNSSGFITSQCGAGAPGTNVTLTGSINLANGQWHHVALDLDGGKPSIYVDGSRVLTSTTVAAPSGTPTDTGLVIGGFGGSGTASFDWTGDIDELRVSTVRRYTGTTYTTPTAPFAADANTKHLIHFDGAATDVATRFVGAGVRSATGLEIINAGRGGTRASDWIASGGTKINAAIRTLDPDVAIVQLDTNEGLNGTAAATYKTNMQTLLNGLVADGIPFVLVASPSLNPGGGAYAAVTQAAWEAILTKEYELADQYDVPLLDTTHMFVDHATAVADGLMGDQVHPNGVGYRRIAQGLARILTT